MLKRYLCLALVFLFLLPAAIAEEKAAPQMWLIFEDVVKPAHIDDYVKASKTFFGMLVEAVPDARWDASMSDDLHFLYSIPISGFGDVGAIYGMMETMMGAIGPEKAAQWMAEMGKPLDYSDGFVVVQRDDLSYHPATMVPREEVRVLEYNIYYLKAGRELMAEALARDYAAAMKKKGVGSGFTLYQLLLGAEMPALAVLVPARSLEELEKANRDFFEKMGEDGMALEKRTFEMTRRFDRKILHVRPDLSSGAFVKKEK